MLDNTPHIQKTFFIKTHVCEISNQITTLPSPHHDHCYSHAGFASKLLRQIANA